MTWGGWALRILCVFGLVTTTSFLIFDVFVQKDLGSGIAFGLLVGLFLLVLGAREASGHGALGLSIGELRATGQLRRAIVTLVLWLVIFPLFTSISDAQAPAFRMPMELSSGLFAGASVVFVLLGKDRRAVSDSEKVGVALGVEIENARDGGSEDWNSDKDKEVGTRANPTPIDDGTTN